MPFEFYLFSVVLIALRCSAGESKLTDGINNLKSGNLATPKIVNGDRLRPSEFPFLVSLNTIYPDGTTGGCSGSLVQWNRVLTAAHCVRQGRRVEVFVGSSMAFSGLKIEAIHWETHPFHNPSNFAFDMAMVFLPDAAHRVTRKIRPLRLPQTQEINKELTHISAGFGSIKPDSSMLGWALRTRAKIINCTQHMSPLWEHDVCAALGPRVAVCHGDSGGPLMDVTGYGPVIVGVFSRFKRTQDTEEVCRLGGPAMYVNVAENMDFIMSNLG